MMTLLYVAMHIWTCACVTKSTSSASCSWWWFCISICSYKNLVFQNAGKSAKRPMAKSKCRVSLISAVSTICENLVSSGLVHHIEICCIFSDFHYGFISSGQLLIFWHFHKIELRGLVKDFKLYHLIYSRLLTEFGMLTFFDKFWSFSNCYCKLFFTNIADSAIIAMSADDAGPF